MRKKKRKKMEKRILGGFLRRLRKEIKKNPELLMPYTKEMSDKCNEVLEGIKTDEEEPEKPITKEALRNVEEAVAKEMKLQDEEELIEYNRTKGEGENKEEKSVMGEGPVWVDLL